MGLIHEINPSSFLVLFLAASSFSRQSRLHVRRRRVESYCEKLLLDYGLRVANWVDLRGFASERLGVGELRNAGLKRLASAVLGKELQKPKRVTMSRWDSQWLSYDQIQYAAVDAFISYEIARQLNLRGA